MQSKSKISTVFIFIVLFIFVVFFIMPLLLGVFISFTDWDGIQKGFNLTGFNNYIDMIRDNRFINSTITTIKYFCILLFGSIVFGFINAKAISKVPAIESPALFFTFFPYIITPVIVSILWNQMFINLFPEIGKKTGISFLETNVLSNPNYALLAIGIVDLWILIPFSMILFYSALQTIPENLRDAAKLDGANNPKILFYIEVPYLLPTVGMIIVLVLSRALTNIESIMVLTSGGPMRATETVYYTIFRNSTEELHYAYGLAEGIVVSIVIIIVYSLVQKYIISKHLDDLKSYE